MGFELEKRQEFLEKYWESYPTSKSLVRGRIVELAARQLVLSIKNKNYDFKISSPITLAPDFLAIQCLKAGDIIEIEMDKTNDEVLSLKLLVPTQGESPFSEIGFTEERARSWSKFLAVIKNFFEKQDFIELRTPTLVSSPGLEPFLDPFETTFSAGKTSKDLFLPTSPEFHLKKALTMGFEKLFEFKECFRNGELSQTHAPEFLMLEWYRAYENLESIMEDVNSLIIALQREFQPNLPPKKVQIFKMEALWKEILNFDLKPKTSLEDLKKLAQEIRVGEEEKDFDDLFNLIILEKVEPIIKEKDEPIIIWHYPPSQAALSRLTKEGWADRFEFYWKGFEIANAFHELNDYSEQKKRFLKDQEKKKNLGKKVIPLDEEFMDALKWGMPPSAGIALGVERLFMALFGLKELKDCRLFNIEN